MDALIVGSELLRAVSQGGAHGGEKVIELAAREFEALLITQMLRSARQASGKGWLGTGEDETAEGLVEMSEECLARALAQAGGLGLGEMVARALGKNSGAPGS